MKIFITKRVYHINLSNSAIIFRKILILDKKSIDFWFKTFISNTLVFYNFILTIFPIHVTIVIFNDIILYYLYKNIIYICFKKKGRKLVSIKDSFLMLFMAGQKAYKNIWSFNLWCLTIQFSNLIPSIFNVPVRKICLSMQKNF